MLPTSSPRADTESPGVPVAPAEAQREDNTASISGLAFYAVAAAAILLVVGSVVYQLKASTAAAAELAAAGVESEAPAPVPANNFAALPPATVLNMHAEGMMIQSSEL